MRKLKLFLLISLLITCVINADQPQFRIIKFDNAKGLTSNLIKDVAQDSSGFIWLATDGGLLKYDGNKFTAYNEVLPSIYLKSILITDDGFPVIATDLSLSKIIVQNNETKIEELLKGETHFTDSLLFYPKTIFEDDENNLWISDNRSITRLNKNGSKKFLFEDKYFSDNYTVSFTPAQNSTGDIYAASHTGFLFKLNKVKEKFELLETSLPNNNFYYDIKFIGGWFYLASSEGLFRFKEKGEIVATEKLLDIANISSITEWKEERIIIGTNYNGVYVFNEESGEAAEIKELRKLVVKNILVDKEKGIWLASDQGLFLAKKNLFKKLFLDDQLAQPENFYVRKLGADSYNNIYFNSGNDLYIYEAGQQLRSTEKVNIGFQIYDFVMRDEYYWISSRQNELIKLKKNNNILYKIKFENDRANHLVVDSQNNLWAYLERSSTIIKIDRNYHQKIYDLNFEDYVSVETLKEIDGEIYLSGRSNELLLAKFNKKNDKFENLTAGQKLSSQISIFDFDKTSAGVFYLGTNRGLWKLDSGKLTSIEFPDNVGKPVVKAVYIEDKDIWCGTDFGLLLIKADHFVFFNQKDGLPNSTISLHGITTSDNEIWVGTPSGLAYHEKEETIRSLNAPELIRIEFKKDKTIFNDLNEKLISGINLSVNYSSLSYPSDRTTYSTRILGLDSVWNAQESISKLNVPNIPAGNYILQIKAESPGSYASGITEFPFEVANPWYFSKKIIPFYVLFALIVILIVNFYFNEYKLKRVLQREKVLNQKVHERTDDLNREKIKTEIALEESEKSKVQLQAANEMKGQLLSIAAHDLKNPLQVILGYEFYKEDMDLNDEEEEMLESIFNAAKKILRMISETLESAAADATQLNLKLKTINLTSILKESVKELQILAERKEQQIQFFSHTEKAFISIDKFWFREAVDNLISNAIKYSQPETVIKVNFSEHANFFLLEIIDQGQGFSESDKEKLFKKFQRLSAAPTGGESSTGLGLFIVKQILDKHGFEIKLESQINEGAKFIINIPKIQNTETSKLAAGLEEYSSI